MEEETPNCGFLSASTLEQASQGAKHLRDRQTEAKTRKSSQGTATETKHTRILGRALWVPHGQLGKADQEFQSLHTERFTADHIKLSTKVTSISVVEPFFFAIS